MTDFITHELTDDGIALVTLSRPPVNALNPEFLGQIDRHLQWLEGEASVRAVVIDSAFKVFSAGLDLKEVVGYSVPQQTAVVDGLNAVFTRLYSFPKPVITAAGGAGVAGGLFFVLAADVAIAADQARFGLTEVRVGASFPVAPLEIARDCLSNAAFRRVLLGGSLMEAAHALQQGLVDEVVPGSEVKARAMDVARDYAGLPPLAFAAIKAQMRRPALDRISETLKRGADPTRSGWFTDETITAMKAALEPSRGG